VLLCYLWYGVKVTWRRLLVREKEVVYSNYDEGEWFLCEEGRQGLKGLGISTNDDARS
jgi:hypothetical protein